MADLSRLESLAQQLIARIRDDDPEANLRWLRAELGLDPHAPVSDLERLLFVVGVAVPVGDLLQERDEAREQRDAAREAHRRLAEAAQIVADALDAVATGGILDSASHLSDLLLHALATTPPEPGLSATETAEPAPARVEGSTEHIGDAEGAVAYWRAEISEILAAWLGEEQRTGWQRLASDVAEQILLDLDIADMAAERDRLRTEAAMLRAEREWLADRARTMGIAEAIIAAHGPAHAVSAEAGRLRAEVKRLSTRVREWEAVNADLAARCDSGDIPTRLGELYSKAVLREIDRLRTERDRLRRRLGDVLDLEELPEDHTIVAAVRRLRALGSTPDTGSTI